MEKRPQGERTSSIPVHERIRQIRWLIPPFVFLGAAIHEIILLLVLHPGPGYPLWVPVLLYGLTGSVVTWWGLGHLAKLSEERERAKAELQAAYDRLAETHRQLLAMHDIGREIASAEDLQHVLEVAARAPVSLINARGSTVVTFDEKKRQLQLDVAWGLSNRYLEKLRERLDEGIPMERCRTCTVLAAHVDSNCPLFDGLQDVAKREGIHSLACLPFGRGEKREGIITAYFPDPEGPPENQLQIFNIVATEIVSALESARLRDQHLEAIYALEHLPERHPDLDALLSHILDITLMGWDVPCGAIFLVEEGRLTPDPAVLHCPSPLEEDALEFVRAVARHALADKAPYVVPDTRHTSMPGATASDRIRSAAAIPLVAGQEVVGVLLMFSDVRGYFRAHHAPFFTSVGHHAGLALRNAQLRSQVQHMAVLEERYRLSREIHDGLAQTLSVIGWRLDRAAMLLRKGDHPALEKELEDIRQELRAAYMDVRQAIDGLRLDLNHPGGLYGALSAYVQDFSQRMEIEVTLEKEGPVDEIPADVGVQLLRIVQESLANVRKHARARHVHIRLSHRESAIELYIEDDGVGFDPRQPRHRSRVGLSSIRERAERLGGTFTLSSRPGAGTRILVVIPRKGEGTERGRSRRGMRR